MTHEFEIVIVGGGIVGAAIGYGLVKAGHKTAIIDGADSDLRASRTNFGLIWVQGKGDGYPPYQQLTRQSADLWPEFAAELEALTGINLEYRRNGGLLFCLSDAEAEENRQLGERMAGDNPGYTFEILDRARLEQMLPNLSLGPKVCAASFSAMDGDVNPVLLLRALLDGFVLLGGALMTGNAVTNIMPGNEGLWLQAGAVQVMAGRVILAAGNDTKALAKGLDLPVYVQPERGQLLITERVSPVFPFAASGVRQTVTGGFQIGGTNERVGRSVAVTSSGAQSIARRAIDVMPGLGSLRVVRQWAGLRVLSPDGFPVYDRSRSHRGIHVATCHSGVTLAAFHAGPYARWLGAGGEDRTYEAFWGSRFETGSASCN